MKDYEFGCHSPIHSILVGLAWRRRCGAWRTSMDGKRKEAGAKLLAAAQEFWNACHEEGQYGAVQWLEGSGGELLIYTRGEYRPQLMANIHNLPSSKVHFFRGEVMPEEDA